MDFMMIITFLVLGLVLGGLCKAKTGTMMNYGTIFIIFWTATGVCANSGYLKVYLPSFLVNVCMLIGMILFAIIYMIFAEYEYLKADIITMIDCNVKIKLIVTLNVVTLCYMIPFFIKAMRIVSFGGLVYLRAISGSTLIETGRTSLSNLILLDISYPLIQATILIGTILIILKQKNAVKVLLLGIINMFVYEMINAARAGFILCFIFMFFAFLWLRYPFISQKVKMVGKEHKFLTFFILVGCVMVLYWMSKSRSLKSISFLQNIYIYYFAGPSYLSQLLNNLGEYRLNTDLFWGRGSFGMIYNLFAIPLNYIGVNIMNSGHVLNSVLSDVQLNISPITQINAMATMYFPFLMDWGYMGMIIGPVIFAIQSLYISKKQLKNFNIRWCSITVYWMYIIYRSIFKLELISIATFFVFFFICLFTYKGDRKTKNYY